MPKIIYLLLMLSSASAWAGVPTLEIKGFGTAGLVRADTPSFFLPEYGTFGQRPTFSPNTRFGLNVSSNLSDGWTVASQFIAENVNLGYTVSLDWGFVSYQPIPELALRGGRLIISTWLFSQQIKVGYSYLWVRPPVEVYSLLGGFTNINGASILSHLPLGGGELSTEVYSGLEDEKTYTNNPASPTSTDIRITDLIGVDLNYSYKDIWTVHASYLQARVVATAYSQAPVAGPIFGTVNTPLDLHLGRFFSVGGKMDYNNFIFITEVARRLIDGQALQTASAWYATLGYRISKITPYLSYAWQGSLSGSFYVHPDAPTVTTLKKELYSYLVGVNAQVNDSVILKAEWEPAFYKFIDSTKDFRANIASVSANFIF